MKALVQIAVIFVAALLLFIGCLYTVSLVLASIFIRSGLFILNLFGIKANEHDNNSPD